MALKSNELIESNQPVFFARCDSKGSFDNLQCMNGYCFCSDSYGATISERRNISLGISQLPCCKHCLMIIFLNFNINLC